MPQRVKKFRRPEGNIFHFGKMDRSVASLPGISRATAAFWPVYFNFGDQSNRHDHATGMKSDRLGGQFLS